MITVRDLLRTKGDAVWFVTPSTNVLEALKYMAEKDIGALLVLEGENLAGIISERDFARMIAESGKCVVNAPIRDYMTTDVYTVSPDQTIADCMRFMTDKHIRHLPVVETKKLVGMVSIGDVVKEIITNQSMIINRLENYIEGRGYGQ
ncbi:MAG: CBS domain-containing protein [Anaerolineaceae bacterium]|nr:CBS domain-containing protein [Anaerolineaceae bacterium]